MTSYELEFYKRDPMAFRLNLLVDGPDGSVVKWDTIMSPVQRQDFQAQTPGLLWIGGRADKPAITKFFLQRSRGYSKTTDIASTLLYLLVSSKKQLDIWVCAEDVEQGKLTLDQAQKIVNHNPWLKKLVAIKRNEIASSGTGATVRFMTSDYASSLGISPDVMVCDELTHWTKEKMWSSVCSSYEKRRGLLYILCNAGYGRDWRWELKQVAISKHGESWYHNAPEGSAPWLGEGMDEQKMFMPLGEFNRLWMNQWQDALGAYLTLAECKAREDPALFKRSSYNKEYACPVYVAGLDYAEKQDRMVGTVCHLYNGHIYVDRMDVWVPELQPDGINKIEEAENWILDVASAFTSSDPNSRVLFRVDPTQLAYVIQRLEGMVEIERFRFGNGTPLCEMAYILRHLVTQGKIWWYPGCGQVELPDGTLYRPHGQPDDLTQELADLTMKQIKGRFRFDHLPGRHDDRAFTLAMLCHKIVMTPGETDFWDIQFPEPGQLW